MVSLHAPNLRVRPRWTGRVWTSVGRLAAQRARSRLAAVLADAGIRLDGDMPWDPVIRHPRALTRILRDGTLGAGDAYVEGDWDCTALDELTHRIMRAGIDRQVGLRWREMADSVVGHLVDRQDLVKAAANGRAHYDLGDDLYATMLGPTMVYSCGYWRAAETLEDAQRAKLELICAKLDLRPGQRLLDVGCGYGELARHAAEHHGVEVVGITVSHNQATFARARCAGLPIEIRIQDYREVTERFDRVVSVGMFEHVGDKNHRRFFQAMRACLAPDGLLLLHTIGHLGDSSAIDPWIDRNIFPGAVLPSCRQLATALEDLFVLEDWHNFGVDYDRTLLAWHANLEAGWPARYDERFRRAWRYYLLTSAGAFRARRNQLWQLVLSPDGRAGGYRRPLL
jgi:cyclopropane-fatty-acyl-phospholipid synthase